MVLDSCRYMNGMLSSLLATYRNQGGIIKLKFEDFHNLKTYTVDFRHHKLFFIKWFYVLFKFSGSQKYRHRGALPRSEHRYRQQGTHTPGAKASLQVKQHNRLNLRIL